MGKRKSAKKPQGAKKNTPLAKQFKCLFCQHNNTVSCKLDQKLKLGRLDCKDCGQTFTMPINHLMESIDVYSEWIDRCEEKELEAAPPAPAPANRKRAAHARDDYEENENDLPDLRKKAKQVEAPLDYDEDEEDLPDPRRRAVVEDDEEDDD